MSRLLLYIYSNRIIPVVLTSGCGVSFVVIIPVISSLRYHSIISVVDDLLSHLSFFTVFLFADRSRVVIEETSGWCVTLMISVATFMAYRI